MMKFEVRFVEKKLMLPGQYGYAQWDGEHKFILVRDDLSWPVKLFVLVHECYHMIDHEGGVLRREAKATVWPVILVPLGMVMTLVQTLFSGTRLKFLKRRLKEKS